MDNEVKLADFRFRANERFLYEYDFGDSVLSTNGTENRLKIGRLTPDRSLQREH
jgi:hypothetical protein